MSVLVQIAIFICLTGLVALITYLVIEHDKKEDNEPYMDWMDEEKWRQK